MREFDKILEPGEAVVWEGAPQFLPFFMSAFIFLVIGIPFLIVGIATTAGTAGSISFLMPQFWIGFVFVVGIPIYTWLVHSRTHYAITNRRAVFQTGLIGRDFRFVDFDQVTNAEVNVGIADKLFGKNSGSLLISSAGTFTQGKQGPVARPYSMRNITNPYDVFKKFKELSHAVKTDISYPNKLRPENNPGYGSIYEPPTGK